MCFADFEALYHLIDLLVVVTIVHLAEVVLLARVTS